MDLRSFGSVRVRRGRRRFAQVCLGDGDQLVRCNTRSPATTESGQKRARALHNACPQLVTADISCVWASKHLSVRFLCLAAPTPIYLLTQPPLHFLSPVLFRIAAKSAPSGFATLNDELGNIRVRACCKFGFARFIEGEHLK